MLVSARVRSVRQPARPGSMTWPVVGDAAVFVGGIRGLLVQVAHPEVAAGVAEHLRYRQDPFGRLIRTRSQPPPGIRFRQPRPAALPPEA